MSGYGPIDSDMWKKKEPEAKPLELTDDMALVLGNILRVEQESLPQQYREGFVPEEVYGEDMTLERYEAALAALVKLFPEVPRT